MLLVSDCLSVSLSSLSLYSDCLCVMLTLNHLLLEPWLPVIWGVASSETSSHTVSSLLVFYSCTHVCMSVPLLCLFVCYRIN